MQHNVLDNYKVFFGGNKYYILQALMKIVVNSSMISKFSDNYCILAKYITKNANINQLLNVDILSSRP